MLDFLTEIQPPPPTLDARSLGTYTHRRLAAWLAGQESEPISTQLWNDSHTLSIEPKPSVVNDAKHLDTWLRQLMSQKPPWTKVHLIEQELEMDIGSVTWKDPGDKKNIYYAEKLTLFGTPDALVTWNNQLWHVQWKTVGSSTPLDPYLKKIQMSLHESAYAQLIRHHYPDPSYGGTMLGIIKKVPPIRRDKTERTLGEAVRLEFLPIPQNLQDWALLDIRQAAQTIYNTTRTPSTLPHLPQVERRGRSTGYCAGPYGNITCPVYNSCFTGVVDNWEGETG